MSESDRIQRWKAIEGGLGGPRPRLPARGKKRGEEEGRKEKDREAICEKILSWHSASADDEINSVRGCGSTMSTGHTPRFERIGRANESVRRTLQERQEKRERKKMGRQGRGETHAGATETKRVLIHVLSASTTF